MTSKDPFDKLKSKVGEKPISAVPSQRTDENQPWEEAAPATTTTTDAAPAATTTTAETEEVEWTPEEQKVRRRHTPLYFHVCFPSILICEIYECITVLWRDHILVVCDCTTLYLLFKTDFVHSPRRRWRLEFRSTRTARRIAGTKLPIT